MKKSEIVLGIDIGGTNTAFGLVDRSGKIWTKDSIPTRPQEGAEALFERIFTNLNSMKSRQIDFEAVKGIGIGAPNGNFFSGKIEDPPNLGWDYINAVELVKKYSARPVKVTNDANAAALGELRFGAAKNMKNFIEITLGTGLGGGIVINGEILYGHFGNAGELGHINVIPGGRLCNCGRKGCLETYVSAEGLKRTVYELLAESTHASELRNVSFRELEAHRIYDIALQGDVLAKQAFEFTGRILGRALADLTAVFAPQAIVLFGGMAQAGSLLMDYVQKYFDEYSLPIFKNKVRLLLSALPSGDAAILGAAALIWHELNHY